MNYLGETLLSPLVMCGPHGLKFEVPVELHLPHCASVNPESWSFALKASDTPGGESKRNVAFMIFIFIRFHTFSIIFILGRPTQWKNLTLAEVNAAGQSCVNSNSVSVLVDHF